MVAGNLLNQVDLPLHIHPCGREGNGPSFGCTAEDPELQRVQGLLNLFGLYLQTHESRQTRPAKQHREPLQHPRVVVKRSLQNLPPGELLNQLSGSIDGRQGGFQVCSPFEPMRGFRMDSQGLGGLSNGNGIEPGTFDQYISGTRVDLAVLASHDSGQRDRLDRIRDEQHSLLQISLNPVESQQSLTAARLSHQDLRRMNLRQIEGVSGMAALHQDVVGGIDDIVDRTNTQGAKPLAQPIRGGPDPNSTNQPRRVAATQLRGLDLDRDLAGSWRLGLG